jgi:hypothetical protein
VLVAGGRGGDATATLASTELFDPKTSVWLPGPPMTSPRAGHTGTLLDDGRVLVVGGTAPARDGTPRLEALDSAEVFDPKTKAWRAVGALADARNSMAEVRVVGSARQAVGSARQVVGSARRVEARAGRAGVSPRAAAPSAGRTAARWCHGCTRPTRAVTAASSPVGPSARTSRATAAIVVAAGPLACLPRGASPRAWAASLEVA